MTSLHPYFIPIFSDNGSVDWLIWSCLKNPSDEVVSILLEQLTEEHYEASMSWDWYDKFGKIWKEIIGDAKLIHPEALRSIQERGLEIDTAKCLVVPERLYKALTKQFEGVGMLRAAGKVNEFYETFSSASDEKIKQGLIILEEAEYNFSPELKFIYGVFGDKRVWARVNSDTKEVLISENIGDKSLFEVVTTLIEENEHFKSGLSDCTREFQQHFINLYACQLLKTAKIAL